MRANHNVNRTGVFLRRALKAGPVTWLLACAGLASAQSIEVTPDAGTVITFSGFEGGPFSPKTVTHWTLDNADAAALEFAVAVNQAWLLASPVSGTLPGSLILPRTTEVVVGLAVDEVAQLAPGVYSAAVTFTNLTNQAGNTTRTVRLEIAAANFSVSPAFINTTATVNGSSPAAVNVSLSGSGQTALNYSLTWSPRLWMSVSSAGGSVPPGGNATFSVSFNTFGLAAGTYTNTISVENTTNEVGSRLLPVTVVVFPSSSGALALTPDADVLARGPEGDLPAASQTALIANARDVSVAWSAVGSAPWVSVTPGAGVLAASNSLSGGPDEQSVEFRVNAARNDLLPGGNVATVTFNEMIINPLSGTITTIPFAARVFHATVDPVLSVTVPLTGGSVSVAPPAQTVAGGTTDDLIYEFGDVVTLTASASDGNQFAGWTTTFELEDPMQNPLVVPMDLSKGVSAAFTPVYWTLTLSTSGNGTGTLHASPTGTFVDNALVSRYRTGASVKVTATADAGSSFLGWSGNVPPGSETVNPLTVTMDADRTITARYEPALQVTVTISGEGDVALDPPGGFYTSGTAVTLTAEPREGFVFEGWSGGVSGTDLSVTITISDDAAIEASFVEDDGSGGGGGGSDGGGGDGGDDNTAKLTVDIVGEGEVTPAGGDFVIGAELTLIATPGIGYAFVRWEEDATGADLATRLRMDGDRTVRAVFELSEGPAPRPGPTAGSPCGALGMLGWPMLALGCASLTLLRPRNRRNAAETFWRGIDLKR
ncbi:MAG: hypothetical protein AABZ12_03945 [Planctomycetota bacterium]